MRYSGIIYPGNILFALVAGTKEGILMIEGAADFLPEETMVEALTLGHKVRSDTT